MSIEVGSVELIQSFPLTGAQEELHSSVIVTPDGIAGDRRMVCYDGLTGNRISTKRSNDPPAPAARLLHRVSVSWNRQGTDALTFHDGTDKNGFIEWLDLDEPVSHVSVNEFGDRTPAYDYGDRVAETLSRWLQVDNVRLALKDYEKFAIKPANRRNAPMHIALRSSLVAVSLETGLSVDVLAKRYRIGAVIDAHGEPFSELDWSAIGLARGGILRMLRPAERCEVPSQHERTGENMKDVAKANSILPSIKRPDGTTKEVFGMYCCLDETIISRIDIGEEVEIIAT